jgi:His Kinase A (phospho-acceptor) domain
MFTVNTSFNDCIQFAPICERQSSLEVLLKLFQSGASIVIVVDLKGYPLGAVRSHRLLTYLTQYLLLSPVGNWEPNRRKFLASSVSDLIEPVEIIGEDVAIEKLTEIGTNSNRAETRIYALVDERQQFVGLLDDRCLLDSVKKIDSPVPSLVNRALQVSFDRGSPFLQQWEQTLVQKSLIDLDNPNVLTPIDIKNDEVMFQEFSIWLAHELKSPLTAIVGLSSLLKEAKPEQLEYKYIHYADLIYRSGRRLMKIVNELFGVDYLNSETVKGDCLSETNQSWKILRLYPQENEFDGDDFDAALNDFLSSLQHRILEADSLEQAEMLARVWKVDAIVLNGSYLSDPTAYLQSFSRSDYLCGLPLVTLDSKTTEAARNIPTLAVFPYLLPIEEQYLNDVLQAIEIAVGN